MRNKHQTDFKFWDNVKISNDGDLKDVVYQLPRLGERAEERDYLLYQRKD